jgi:lysophospholipase L1-like esterase
MSGSQSDPAEYHPCPTRGACKVLPFGDSITRGEGVEGEGGYRMELFRKAVADAKGLRFVGSELNGPQTVAGVTFPRNHEGHGGWKIDQVSSLVPIPALQDEPHIVLLMIGTNDVLQTHALDAAPERLGVLIDSLVAAAPEALIVVAQITPLEGFGAPGVEAYNQRIPALVEARAAEGKHVLLVDMSMGFSTEWLPDGVHPNETGYAHMASVWYQAISDFLPTSESMAD